MDPLVAALVAGIAAGITALWRSFIKGDVILGSLYREQVVRADKAEARAVKAEARADKADVQAERNTDALVAVTETVKAAGERRDRGSNGG